ncbi:MAG: cytochrome P450 [Chloroflexi bacterium]|nr:cytochrome P450 [Chloroflexota bacterium]
MPSQPVPTSDPAVNLLSPEFLTDPYPIYDYLRRNAPVYFIEPANTWVITRYRDCVSIFKDPRASSTIDLTFGGVDPAELPQTVASVQANMVFMDDPDHARLRALVHKSFTPSLVENMRGQIEQVVNELLDDMDGQSEIDLIKAFSYPLPVLVIADPLGVPFEDRNLLRQWSQIILQAVDPLATPDVMVKGEQCLIEFSDYLTRTIEDRRRHPREDLLTKLVQVEEQGDRLSYQELLSTCILLLIAGHETTTSLIANGILTLLRHPHQLLTLRANLHLIPAAIEEILRYDSPVPMNPRKALEPITLDSHPIQDGQIILVMTGSANRDPEIFERADIFDINRTNNPHLTFGKGIHYCLGAPLARLEGAIAFRALLKRFPNMQLSSTSIEYNPTLRVRTPKELLLTL